MKLFSVRESFLVPLVPKADTRDKTPKIILTSISSVVLLAVTIASIVHREKLKIRFNSFKYKYFASASKPDDGQPDTISPVPLPFIQTNSDESQTYL